MSNEPQFAFDSMQFDLPKASVRTTDDNGFMHVALSPLTKEQVAPYYGREIPNYQSLGFEPDKIYHGYRSAKELSKPDTVNSVNGIPLQLQHHPDFANAPAKETRVGATGTDGAWKPPYLMNSLVVFDKVAQDGIENRSMRELSLAYRYTPVKESGEALGQHYDFLMTDISANHIALVEQGRAGSDVLVLDHNSITKDTNPMIDESKEKEEAVVAEKICNDDEPNPEAGQGDKPPVEPEKSDSERLAVLEHEYQELAVKLKKLEDVEKAEGHKELQAEAEDEDEEESPANPPADVEEAAPESEEEASAPEAPVEEEAPASEDGEEQAPAEEQDDMIAQALKACGMEGEPPEIQKAFAEGIKYGQKVVAGAPKQPEAEVAQDAALDVHTKAKELISAMQDVRSVLGDVKVDAYDSACGIYSEALEKLGVKGVSVEEAPRAYEMFMRGRKSTEGAAIAQDAKSVGKDAISDILNKVNTSI